MSSSESSDSSTSSSPSSPKASQKCSVKDCPQPPFQLGMCIDHHRVNTQASSGQKIAGQQNHNFLNSFGKKKLDIATDAQKINKTYLDNPAFDVTQERLDELILEFQGMDENGDGEIDIDELGRALEKLGKPKSRLQLKKMIDEVDLDKNGCINYNEFLNMMLGKMSSVLRLILLFEKKAKEGEEEKKQQVKGQYKPKIDLTK